MALPPLIAQEPSPEGNPVAGEETGTPPAARSAVKGVPGEHAAHEVSDGGAEEPGDGEGTKTLEERLGKIYRDSCMSVVLVRNRTQLGEEVITGFAVAPDLVATAFVDDTFGTLSVVYNGAEYAASVAAFDDSRTKLAFLRVSGIELPPVAFGKSDTISLGGFLSALTETPNPIERAVAARLAGREVSFGGRQLPVPLLRLHLAVNPSLLGAPVLDETCALVGVVLLRIEDGKEAAYALPVELVEKMLQLYRERGAIGHGWIGITLDEGTTTPRVLKCREGGPAALAGVREDDVILRIGDHPVRGYQDIVGASYVLSPGQETTIEYLRGLELMRSKIVPQERPTTAPVAAPPSDEGGARPAQGKVSDAEANKPVPRRRKVTTGENPSSVAGVRSGDQGGTPSDRPERSRKVTQNPGD